MLVICVLLAVVGFAGSIVANQLLGVIAELPDYRDNIRAKASQLRGPMQGSLRRAAETVDELSKEVRKPGAQGTQPVPVEVVDSPTSLAYLRSVLDPVLRPLEIVAVALIFTIFILLKREDLRNRIFRLAGLARLSLMTEALDDAASRISRYLAMQLAVNTMFGALLGFGLFLLGIPAAALWAVLAALGRFVPYVGILVAGACPILVSLAVSTGWVAPVAVIALIVGLELMTANLFEPWLYGSHTGISPLALLVSATFWTMIWGWAGLLLSTPLTVCLSVLGKHVPQLGFLHILLGDEDVLAPGAHLYQRLLAMDQDESRAIAIGYLADHSVADLYDQVMVPALNLAEHDRHKGKLDEARENFVFMGIRELLSEIEDERPRDTAEAMSTRVICVPANDQADEIAASMLAQLIRQSGAQAVAPRLGRVRSLARLSIDSEDVICISALPPFAFTHAKEMHRRMRTRFPKSRIVLGLWGFSGDLKRTAERLGRERPDQICTTFQSALDALLAREPVSSDA